MGRSVEMYNDLVGRGEITARTLLPIAELALLEGQHRLHNRCREAIEVAREKGADRFLVTSPAIEQLDESGLCGLEPVPSHLASEGYDGLGRAVSPNDIYDYITKMVVSTIEESGELPWQKQWESTGLASGKVAYSYHSKKEYRGINYFLLNFKPEPIEGTDRFRLVPVSYDNPAFLTPKHIDRLKGKIKKGASAHRVVYFTKLYLYEQLDPKMEFGTYDRKKFTTWIEKNRKKLKLAKGKDAISAERLADIHAIPILKYYNVFNAGDTEGIEFKDIRTKETAGESKQERIDIAEAMVEGYPSPPKIVYRGSQPHYNVATDTVEQTPIEDFKDPQGFYSVLFHELVHSTGAKKRLGRTFGRGMKDPNYAREELVAEMGAVFLCAESGILFRTLANSAAYLKSWNGHLVDHMKKDNRFFFSASSKAQAAVDHILDRDGEGVPAYRKILERKKKTDVPTKAAPKKTVPGNRKKVRTPKRRAEKKDRQLELFAPGMSAPLPGFRTRKEAKDFVSRWARRFLKGKKYYHRQIGKYVLFSMRGIDHAISSDISIPRALLITRAFDLLENSELQGFETDPKGRPEINGARMLDSHTTLNGARLKVKLTLREGGNGTVYYDHRILEVAEPSPAHPGGKERPESVRREKVPQVKSKKNRTRKSEQGLNGPAIPTAYTGDRQHSGESCAPGRGVVSKKLGSFGGTTEMAPPFPVAGELSKLLQKVEKKPVHSVVVTMDGEKGCGKTTTLYRFMQDLADAGNDCLFASLEEHPGSNLAREKANRYLSESAISRISTIAEFDSYGEFCQIVEQYDTIVIDSWQKLVRMIGKISMDEQIRKRFDGKLFVIIFQQTVEGRTKGGAEIGFDGDVILKGVKEKSFADNHFYVEKHRYTEIPIEQIRYMIAEGRTLIGGADGIRSGAGKERTAWSEE